MAPAETHAPLSTLRPFVFLTFWSIDSNRMPIQGRVSASPATACCMIGLAMSIGMAKPMPDESVATAVLMPTTAPAASTSGPPELPGLIAASVWMQVRDPLAAVDRDVAALAGQDAARHENEYMPSGEPIATTSWPILSPSEVPISATGRSGSSTLTMARSVSVSMP